MIHRRWRFICVLLLVLAASVASAQQFRQPPKLAYAYPAGGRQGETFEVTLGGQYLNEKAEVLVSGEGVSAAFVDLLVPPTQKELANIREIFERARKQVQEKPANGQRGPRMGILQAFAKLAREEGITDKQIAAFNKYRMDRADPKRQLNPQLADSLIVRVTVAPDAASGTRELRITTPNGLSNPIRFQVGGLAECRESEPNDAFAKATVVAETPAVLNGQIMPGDVDRFRLKAKKGQHLVVKVSARELTPYLADAVPGWFQAVTALYDADGREVAYDDDYRFNPDPVLLYEAPRDGEYVLEVRDSIYRGREDFVYRVAVGELPFISSVFPLGGRRGARVAVSVEGWNLPVTQAGVNLAGVKADERPFRMDGPCASNAVPFAVDDLDEMLEQEPNDDAAQAARASFPLIINGRIDRPGDWDVYRLNARAGQQIVAEVHARRLGSPLDSLLKLTDTDGRLIAFNDDHEDKASGLETHHADSQLIVNIPKSGDYLLWLGDTQKQGGKEFGYRLRLSYRRPDFELRVTPSAVNTRGGSTVPITVFALRRDGFDGDIALRLKDAPAGFSLSGAWVPAGQEKIELTLTVPAAPPRKLTQLAMEGAAKIGVREVLHEALPADDMEQAFLYRHLVPTDTWTAAVEPVRWAGAGWFVDAKGPVRLKAGRSTVVRVKSARRAFGQGLKLELSDPPEGITLESVNADAGGYALTLRAEAGKAKPGLKGNLIFGAFNEFTPPKATGQAAGQTRRVSAGVLPAVAFEVEE